MAYEGGDGGRGGERGREKLANIFTAARVFQRPIFLEGRRGVKCVPQGKKDVLDVWEHLVGFDLENDTRTDENIRMIS